MNKNLYRVIFNKKRGMQMVVAEIATTSKGHQKAATDEKPLMVKALFSTLKPITLFVSLSLGFVTLSLPAYGSDIVADNQAAKNQRPQVISTANGITQVNIQTPNSKGVSHNKYQQFDVSERGAILNNSGKISQTQIAGYVQGNEFLKSSGPAKIILNEVNSRNPSQLNGVIEVAGQKAQVVIANPSGITCNGCGFINASRSTLTTGKPIMQNGELTGYRVEQGQIVVTGKGLDSTGQSYTDLISRTVSVNSAIWANELNVVTGKNQVSQDGNTIIPLADSGEHDKPEVSIDVSQLGGMYAGAIRMVGTEKGVGVHNAGELGASVSTLSISADGKITNRGAIQAQQNIELRSRGDIDNQKQIYSKQKVTLSSGKTISNDGTLMAKNDIKLNAKQINSSQKSAIIAGVDTQGKLTQAGNIEADANKIALNGQNKASQKLALNAKQSVNLDNSQTYAHEIKLNSEQLSLKSAQLQTEQQLNLNHSVAIDTSNVTLQTPKGITLVTDKLTNNNGTFIAQEDINLKANQIQSQEANLLTNGKLTIDANDIALQKATLSAKGAILLSGDKVNADELALVTEQTLQVNGQALSTNQADLQAKQSIAINANNYYAQHLKLITTGALSLKANNLQLNHSQIRALNNIDITADALQSQQSNWLANNDINVTANHIDNQSSKINAVGTINYQFTTLNNNYAHLISGRDLTFTGDNLQNQQATWQSGNHTNITINGLFDNQFSTLIAKGQLAIRALTMNNDNGQLISDQTLSIDSKQLSSHNGVLQAEQGLNLNVAEQFAAHAASLYSGQQMVIDSDNIDLSNATIGAKGDITLKGAQQQLNHSEVLSNGQIQLSATNIKADDAVIKSANDLTIQALAFAAFNRAQLVTNQILTVVAGQAESASSMMYAKLGMGMHFNALKNQNSSWLSEGAISLFAKQFNNQNATIEAKQNIDITAEQFNNRDTTWLTEGGLIIDATDIDNHSAQMQSKAGIDIHAQHQLSNDNALLISEQGINIQADEMSNTHAQFSGNQSIDINANRLDNQYSAFFSGGKINLISQIFNNEDSEIKAKQGIDIQTQSAASDRANYVTEGDFTFSSQQAALNNATIASKGKMNITGDQQLSLQDAQLTSLEQMQLKANTLNSSASDIYSLGNIDITAQTVKNDNASLISDQDISIHADTIDTTESEIGAEGNINVSAITLNNNKAIWVAKKAISINAQKLTNIAAQLASHQSLNIHAKQIDNQHAVLSAKETIAIDADKLDNSQAKLFSNQSVTLVADELNNREGTIKADQAITINSQQMDNNNAILVAENAIDIQADTLNNTKAALQSQSQITIKTNQLNNESALLLAGENGLNITSGQLNNQQAQLFSKGDLTLNSQHIDNQHANILTEKALNINAQQINNQQAQLQAKGNITLQAVAQNNQQATILSEQDIKLTATDSLDNRDAQLTANGVIDMQASNHINNSHANLLANRAILLNSADVDNQLASLKTNGLIDVKAGSLNNQQAEYLANDIVLTSPNLNNQHSKLTANEKLIIDAQHFDNTQGQLLANDIYLKTRVYRGNGNIQSKNNLSLDLEETFVNETQLSANGHLSIRTQNDIINKNKITAGKQVSLESQQLTNEQQAEISAEYLSLKHQNVTNHGLIDATTAVMRTNKLDNLAGGRIYADNLAIHANWLNNLAKNNLAPVIAARQNFHLGVETLNNYTHAQLLSLGNFIIGGGLDENWNVTGMAKQINNHSATIEAHGDLSIAANQLNNINDHIVTEMRKSDEPPETETYFQTSAGDGQIKYSPDEVTYRIHTKYMRGIACQSNGHHHRCYYWWKDIPEHLRHTGRLQRMSVPSKGVNGQGDSWEYNVIKHTYRTVILETDPSKISAAGNVIIRGQTINNQDSKIVAGKTVNINAAQLNNQSQEAITKYVYSGKVYLHKRLKQDKYSFQDKGDYTKPDEIFIDNALNKNIVDHQIFEKTKLTEQPRSEVNVENSHNSVVVDKTVNDTLSQQAKVVSAQSIAINSNQSDKTKIKADAYHPQGSITTIESKPDTNIEEDLTNQERQHSATNEPIPQVSNDITPSKTISVYEPNLTLPDNSLWIVNKDTNKNYLVETDPRFTNRKKWLSSDYMLKRLTADPDSVLKRLGDGYYEQQLIQQQIVGLTGHRYLQGYQSDLEQYQALMDAGVSFAQEFGIAIGLELTGEQMRALTTDIVLLVKKTVMVNGKPTEVLVPQVYIVNRPQLGTDGAVIAGDNVFVKGEQLNNTGLIAAKQDALLDGYNVTNKGTIYGGRVEIDAQNDIINYGKLVGDKLVYLSADNDINLLSSTRTQTRERNLLTNIDQASTIQVNNGNIVINAGHDIHAKAGYIVNSGKEGTTWLQAGHDIGLTTADIEEKFDITSKKDYRRTDEKGVVGTEIMAANNIQLVAGNDIKAKTVGITAGGHLGLQAGNDISIEASQEHFDLDEFHKSKTKGFLKSSSEKTRTIIDNNKQKGSELYGDSVTINAGNNLSVTGSQVVGTNDVNLKAGNDIKIDAAEESYYRKEQTIKKKSGLMGSGGIGFTIGKEKESLKQTDTEQAYVGSVVGSTDGSVNIQAGKDIAIKGSDVIAKQDIKLQGENVNIEALDAKTTYNEEYKYKKTGVTVAITGTASDIYQANQTRQQASQQTNSKTKALMDIKAGLQAGNAALETASNLQNNTPSASVGINVSIGSEKTKRTVNQEQHTVVSSSISAGHNATIIATGNGEKDSGDINIIGSQIQAGHDTTLNAKHDINIIGQENTEKTDRKEKSSSGSVSVGYNFGGEKNGFNVSANASQSKSREKGNGTDWTESIVEAGNKLTIVSGNDVNISAGQVKGDTVVANIGHDLNITSQQDSDEYHQKNSSTSVGGSFSYGGTSSVNASGSSTKMDSKWKSVTDQSGIFAGKGGYDITVGNNTDLKGAVIASEADDTRKNRLDTGTISFSDIENKADFKVSSSSAGINTSGMPTPPSSYNNDGNKKSTTHSAVSEGTLIVRDQEGQQQDINNLSRDTEDANHQLKHIFNKDKEQSIIDQTRLVSEIGGQTLTMLNNIDKIQATAKAKKALEEAEAKAQADKNNENGGILTEKEKEEIYKKAYDKAMNEGMSAMGSDMRQGVEMAVSLINGIISGDITGAAAGALAPKIASAIKQATEHYNPETGKTEIDYAANTISHAILGAVVAQLQGNSAIAGGLGAAGSERGAEIIAGILYPDKDIDKLSQEERQTISALTQLATGLATAALGGDTQDVNTAIAGGKNAVENNRLNTVEEQKRINELAKDNEREKLLYQAAACALVHCSAEFADDDPMKAVYQKLEELGSSDELQAYREALALQEYIKTNIVPDVNGFYPITYETVEKLFEYTSGDEFVDSAAYIDNKYSVKTRLLGLLQVLGALGEGGLAVALSPGCTTVIGCGPSALLSWSAVDNGMTGVAVIIDGKSYTTLTGKGLAEALNISESDGDLLFNAITGLLSAKKLGDLASSSLSSGNKLTAKELDAIKSELDRVGNKLKVDPHAGKGNNIAKSVTTDQTGIKWGEGIKGQGMPWEDFVGNELPAGARLPENFKTFDYFDRITKNAVSVKTLDTTTAAKLANPKQIYNTLKNYIDKVADFEKHSLSGVTITSSDIMSREIRLAVPAATTKAQWQHISNAIDYGKSRGVKLIVTEVK